MIYTHNDDFQDSRFKRQILDKTHDWCDQINISSAIHTMTNEKTMALTKHAATKKIESELKFNKQKALETVEYLLQRIKSSLESGEDVLISGFGKICVRDKRERKGRNPATGEAAILPARRVVTFKWSRTLREKINGR